MAAGSTIYNFQISLSDTTNDRYEELTLRIARHASEVIECTLCKALAYCLEFQERLEFSKGLDDPEMPALWARDRTGEITHWIEVGSPSVEKLHKASKNVKQVSIYTYKDPDVVLQQLVGQKIHRAEQIQLCSFSNKLLTKLAPLTDKRNVWSLTVSEETIYLEVIGESFTANIEKHILAKDIIGA